MTLRHIDWNAVAARYKAGETTPAIADDLCCNASSVVKRLRRLGVQLRARGNGCRGRLSERNAQIAAQRGDGRTYLEIAKAFGLTKQRVAQIVSGTKKLKAERERDEAVALLRHIAFAGRIDTDSHDERSCPSCGCAQGGRPTHRAGCAWLAADALLARVDGGGGKDTNKEGGGK